MSEKLNKTEIKPKIDRSRKTLSRRQKAFADSYLQGKSRLEAVKDANYNATTKASASVIACKNLQNPEIRHYIKEVLREYKITPEKILKRLDKIVEDSDNDKTVLETVKYLFELMGYSKQEAVNTAQKLIFNIDKAVIPQNIQYPDYIESPETEDTQQKAEK